MMKIVYHLISSFKLTFIHIFILVGPGLILAFLMNLVAGSVEKCAYSVLGRRIYLSFFGWLGTVVHELGHAVMCIVFRHRINEIVFFDPDSASGTLGYVNHSYNEGSAYQVIGNFFIGIGPIIFGTIVIFLSGHYLIKEGFFLPFDELKINHHNFQSINEFKALISTVGSSFVLSLANIFSVKNLTRWQFYVFFYILFCVGSSIRLSRADIESAVQGFVVIFMIFFIINFLRHLFGGISPDFLISVTKNYSAFYAMMVFVILMNILLAIPLYFLRKAMSAGQEF